MCFEFLVKFPNFAIAIAPELSSYIFIGLSNFISKDSLIKLLINNTSDTASDKATYPANVQHFVTALCLWVFQTITFPNNLITKPVVDFRSILSPAKSESTIEYNISVFILSLYVNFKSLVLFKYFRILIAYL